MIRHLEKRWVIPSAVIVVCVILVILLNDAIDNFNAQYVVPCAHAGQITEMQDRIEQLEKGSICTSQGDKRRSKVR